MKQISQPVLSEKNRKEERRREKGRVERKEKGERRKKKGERGEERRGEENPHGAVEEASALYDSENAQLVHHVVG
jgi:hypothetical protein